MNTTKQVVNKYIAQAYGPTTEKLRAEQAERNGSGSPWPAFL